MIWLKRTGLAALLFMTVLGVALVTSTGCLAAFGAAPDKAALAARAKVATYVDGRFANKEPEENFNPSLTTMVKEGLFGTQQRTPPSPPPVLDPREAWKTPPPGGVRATWLGHSTVLLELDGFRVLTDPIWGERASPSTLAGPRRFHPPPVPLEALPPLDAVIISHDHYDHLDMPTIRALAKGGARFFVPLGLGAHLLRWEVPPGQVTELDWWEQAQVKEGLTLVATPSRHFSGRSLTDRNRTLWASWVVKGGERRAWFSGDTGLTPQFAEIGQRHGPFDLVMLEVGAFHPSWGDIHLGPERALEAHALLGGGALLPIHWGTFNLAFHAWDDPAVELVRLARDRGVPVHTPKPGGTVEPLAQPPLTAAGPDSPGWWESLGER